MNIIRSVFSSVMHETRLSGDGERQEEAGHPPSQRPRVSGRDQSDPGGDGQVQ